MTDAIGVFANWRHDIFRGCSARVQNGFLFKYREHGEKLNIERWLFIMALCSHSLNSENS